MSRQPKHINPEADRRLKELICERFTSETAWDTSGIHVEVFNGVATLAGVVSHKDEILLAENIAKDLEGVGAVRNLLEVKGSGIAEVLSELGSDIARVISGNDPGHKTDDKQ